MKILVIYSFIFFLINQILLKDYNNTFLFESFTVLEFILFSAFLHTQLKNKKAKKALVITSIGFTLFYFGFTFFGKEGVSIDSVQIGIETIVILIFSYYYLYERMNDTSTLFIYSTYPFWVVLGIVIYLSGSFFVYIFADTLSHEERAKFWIITNIVSVVKSIFFVIAIIINSKPTKNTINSDFELSSLN